MLTLYNSLSRRQEPFEAIEPGRVRMYVCGMTVYDYCHVGHARMLVVFDVIRRWLEASGYAVTYVRNVTDVDDKIIARARENGEPVAALTDRFIRALAEDAAALGVLPPTQEPLATAHVPDMITMIQALQAKGLAYAPGNGDVYFSVAAFPGYGKLSGKTLADLRAGERVEVNPHKRDPLDFVLWKGAKADEPFWDSPWGPGRPGWHIECSAMSEHFLGMPFDIHGGGQDLQFPHHENEIAQSEGAHERPFVRYWLHNGFVRVDDEKMSKSLGNFFTVREVLSTFHPETLRFFILRAHYRSPLNYSDAHLHDARHGLARLYTALASHPAEAVAVDWDAQAARDFKQAMDNDFNTPEAVAVLFGLANEVNRAPNAQNAGLLRSLAGILGLLQGVPQDFLRAGGLAGTESREAAVAALVARRDAARLNKDYAEADRIRDELLTQGVVLEDTAAGTVWRRQ